MIHKIQDKRMMKIDSIKNSVLGFIASFGVAIMLFVLAQFAFVFVEGCQYKLLWKILLSIAGVLLIFGYYVWWNNKKNSVLLEITNPPLVKKYNVMRKYIEKNRINKPYNDAQKFDEALSTICERVYEALSNENDKAAGYPRYAINVLLLTNDTNSNKRVDMFLALRKSFGFDKIRDDYSIDFNRNSGIRDLYKLSNNTPYNKCFRNYEANLIEELIQVNTDVRNKIKQGNYKSALNGYWEFPYDSSIVVPILPLVNEGKVEFEGFFNIISDSSKPFNDKGFTDEHKEFLEAVSGCFYEVCHNYQPKP